MEKCFATLSQRISPFSREGALPEHWSLLELTWGASWKATIEEQAIVIATIAVKMKLFENINAFIALI
ncbi:MAG: hypothetical protein ACM3VS_03485 [Candidatus Dadabacteria bacterium]